MCAIQEFLSSFELVWISYISGPFKEALIKNIAFSSLATSLTINFCNEITGGLESCKTKYNLLHYIIHVPWGLFPTYTGQTWAIILQHYNFIAMASSHDISYVVIFYSSIIDENMERRMYISKTRGLGTDWMLKRVSTYTPEDSPWVPEVKNRLKNFAQKDTKTKFEKENKNLNDTCEVKEEKR